MQLSELLKLRGMKAQLERETGVSAPNLQYRATKGWCVGELNGVLVMYNPALVTELGDHHKAAFDNWSKENGE